MTEQYTKQQRLDAITLLRQIMTTEDTVLEVGCDEENMVLNHALDTDPVNAGAYNSGYGSGCGGYQTYEINGVVYDVVTPDVVEPDKFHVIRKDPIDWDAKVRDVEREG